MFLTSSGLSSCPLKMAGTLLPQGPCISCCISVECSWHHSLPLQLQASLAATLTTLYFSFPDVLPSTAHTYSDVYFCFTYVLIISFPLLNVRSVKCRDFCQFYSLFYPQHLKHIVDVELNLVKCVINKCVLGIEKNKVTHVLTRM